MEAMMKDSRLLFLSSWIILLVLSAFLTLGSLGALGTAYFGARDNLTSAVGLDAIENIGGEEAVDAFRGRRVTAASWAFGCGVLAILVVLVPYRRGERWSWWALLVSVGLSQLLSMARAPVLGTTVGAGTAGLIFGLLVLGLLAGAPRMFAERTIE
jgi:hypothetical protein